MYGAIIGDIVGSPYERDGGSKTKDFPLFVKRSRFTDDTVMTVAVAEAVYRSEDLEALDDEDCFKNILIDLMHHWGRKYPRAGYGRAFSSWLALKDRRPYNSWGNGSAMRVSAAGWAYDDMEKTRRLARWTSEVTHDHPEGVKGAEAIAAAIFMARKDNSKDEIRRYVETEFGYDVSRTCDEIRPGYRFDVSCQGSVPETIMAFLDGEDFEDVIRTAVSLGGDTDTIAAMAGSIAEAFYGVPDELIEKATMIIPERMEDIIEEFDSRFVSKD